MRKIRVKARRSEGESAKGREREKGRERRQERE